MKEKPSYYAIIPATVRYDENLKASEKLLYAEITALCNNNGICTANNYYFSELYNVDKTTVSRWVSNLKKYNYINIFFIYKENSKEVEVRNISITPLTKKSIPLDEKVNTPLDEKVKDNIVIISSPLKVAEINNNITKIDNSEFAKLCLKDTQWLEITCMQTLQDQQQTKNNLIAFNKHLIRISKQYNSLVDYKRHYSNWGRKQNFKKRVKIENPYKGNIKLK